MKRALLVATSVLALAAVSKPLVAAESETPAPTERAAPATEPAPAPTERAAPAAERAPARERAAPARQRQVARTTPQQSTSSQTSSYTGTQAGGFGGGNAGGGGFADPVCLNGQGSSSSSPGQPSQSSGGLNSGCTGVPFNQSLTNTGGIGGGTIQWMVPVTPWIVVGVVGDVSFGKTTSTSTQNNSYAPNLLIPSQVTQEQITNSFSQSTSGSARLKVGFVIPLQYTSIMPYFTAGYIHSTLQGTFSYSASNYNTMNCYAFNPMCATNAFSATSWSRSSNGFVWGVGAEMPLSAFVSGIGPGVVLVADYTRAQFGSFDVNLPVAIASVPGGFACVQSSGLNCAAVDTAHLSNVVSNRFTFGARVKLF
jgi:hypothetical protein